MNEISVLIVDSSNMSAMAMCRILHEDEDIRVTGIVSNAQEAKTILRNNPPDIVTVDTNLKDSDWLEFVKAIIKRKICPVVVIGMQGRDPQEQHDEAINSGVVGFLEKPRHPSVMGIASFSFALLRKVRKAGKKDLPHCKVDTTTQVASPVKTITSRNSHQSRSLRELLVIGASTGGVEALKEVISKFPEDCPATVIAQHIPVGFSQSFANSLSRVSSAKVVQATDCMRIEPGTVYIAPGDEHLLVQRVNDHYVCRTSNSERVNLHRPSVDVLFESVLDYVTDITISAAILTRMSRDRSQGIQKLHDKGVYTIAQDEQTSVVWSMPQAAIELGAIDTVQPLNHIAEHLLAHRPNRARALQTLAV